MLRSLLLATAATLAMPGHAMPPPPTVAPLAPITWKEIAALPAPAAGEKLAYGEAPQQFGELRLPAGKGPNQAPYPVAVLVHGGCWLAAYDYQYFNHLAAALTARGVATWTVEYRRLGDAGGGWPHTLLDVAKATDHLRVIAKSQPLDLSRVVSIGHSAGGQLALWLGARHKLATTSELFLPEPLALKGVVGLAPITDLASYRIGKPDSCNASVDQLMGGSEVQQATRYAQASPLALLPLGLPQVLVQGGKDPIVPLDAVARYAQAALAKGDAVQQRIEPALGHFDPAVPQTLLGAEAVKAVLTLLGADAR